MDLELTAAGRRLRFPAVWLRDNCPCAECQDPGSGQKLKDITDIPNDLAITLTEDAADSVAVTFAPDQHRSVFARSWLAAYALNGRSTSGWNPSRATWPSPAGRSCRTPTTRTATRCRPCSCCTACARQ